METTIKEEKGILHPEMHIPCPNPFHIKIDAATPNFFAGDFNPAWTNHQEALNYTAINKMYFHTFIWKPQFKCCQVTKAVLTVKMKANQNGSLTGANAGNDSISIVTTGGVVIAPHSEKVYINPPVIFPFPSGQIASKTWGLSPAAINSINLNKRLSFLVQDDTSVTSAVLELWGCCLKVE